MPDNNLYSHFKKQFDRCAERVLLTTTEQRTYTFSDADRESAKLASLMRSRGIEPGDRVSVQVEKSPQALFLYLACLRAGFVFHPLNPAYQSGELEYFLGNARPALVVCDPERYSEFSVLCASANIPHLMSLDSRGGGSLGDAAAVASEQFGIVPRAGDDLAALLYSSGTTGLPKGIMLTHDNLLRNTEALVEAWGFSEGDCLLHALPIFHVHGLFVANGCAMLSGASMRWLANFSPAEAIRCLPQCTVMMGVPTYYTRLLAAGDFDETVCNNMRLFVSGSAPLLEETFNAFEERTGHRILERYGMTETNMNTSNPLHGERKPGTVGLALPGVTVRVVNSAGEAVPQGEIGALQVRGPNVFKGYWQMPEKTADDFTADGFFNTGDTASVDEDGYVSIVGRAKDLVITGGLNVYPKEIELFLDKQPGVAETAVIGIPHADFGEAVVAVVVAADATATEERLIRAAKSELANFKVPKKVVFVDELPRNTMAKVQKNELRQRYAGLFS